MSGNVGRAYLTHIPYSFRDDDTSTELRFVNTLAFSTGYCVRPSAKAEKGLLRGTQRRIENVTLAEACVLQIKALRQIGNGDAIVARPHVVDAESAVSSDNGQAVAPFL